MRELRLVTEREKLEREIAVLRTRIASAETVVEPRGFVVGLIVGILIVALPFVLFLACAIAPVAHVE
jgi:hypothetical protein